MLATALALTLAVAPVPLKLAAPGFECVHLEAEVCALHTDTFAQLLGERGVPVTTQREIAALLGMERQRQLLGCSDAGSSCMAELAGALGVDGVVTGSIGKLGSAYTVNVKIVSVKDGSALGARSGRVKDDDALHAWFVETAQQLASALGQPVTSTASGGLRSKAWIPLLAGGLALAGGATLLVLGNADARIIRVASPSEPATLTEVDELRTAGEAKQVSGVALIAAGSAAVLVGAGFLLFGPGEPTVALQVSPQMVGLSLSGAFP